MHVSKKFSESLQSEKCPNWSCTHTNPQPGPHTFLSRVFCKNIHCYSWAHYFLAHLITIPPSIYLIDIIVIPHIPLVVFLTSAVNHQGTHLPVCKSECSSLTHVSPVQQSTPYSTPQSSFSCMQSYASSI